MSWTEFIKYTGILYLLYYGVNILVDLLWPSRSKPTEEAHQVLHFSEQVEPIVVESPTTSTSNTKEHAAYEEQEEQLEETWERDESDTEELTLHQENINSSSGGIFTMVELNKAAKSEAVMYTGHLVY